MEVTLSDLQITYAAKTDEELLRLHARGTLTEVAYQAIEAELAKRQITMPPRPAQEVAEVHQDDRLRGLGGWLVLVGIGVVLAPIRISATVVTSYLPVFTGGSWEALTTEQSDAYHPLWAPIIIGALVFNVAMVGATIYLVILFFSKSYLFPRAYVALTLASIIFIPFDAWVVTFALPNEPMFDEATAREFGRVLVGGLIWIPYLFNSRRVRATFVEGRPAAVVATGG
jgi:hypothetical protein